MLKANSHNIISLSKDHALQLSVIHQECFKESWSKETFCDFFNENKWGNIYGFGILLEEQVKGFILARHILDSSEILTFAVSKFYQSQGYGRLLLDKLLQDISYPIFLEVAVNNNQAIHLYQSIGFKILAERPDYYKSHEGKRTPAYLMQYKN